MEHSVVKLQFHEDIHKDVLVMFLSTFFFYIFRICVHKYLPVPRHLSPKYVERWFNYSISLFHSVLTAVGSVSCLLLFPEFRNDFVEYQNECFRWLVVASTGYFIYDFIDNLLSRELAQSKDIILHHVVTIGTFGFAIVTQQLIVFAVLALLAEVNSVFLHSRQLIKLAGNTKTGFYYVIFLGTVISFVAFRFGLLYYYWIVLPVIAHLIGQPYLGLTWAAWSTMVVVNIVLFKRLLQSDLPILLHRKSA